MKERLLQLAAGWVDTVYRRLNDKRYLPSWSMRATVGFPADFEVTGAEFTSYLKLLCDLKSHHTILDIGCGCGMLALQLRDYLANGGSYVGMDIDRSAISWCQSHITRCNSHMTFYHADLVNPRYNPTGAVSAIGFRFPETDASFDNILLKSVFTHMLPGEVRSYLEEIARLLKPRGRCLATFFLLNTEQADLEQKGKALMSFAHDGDTYRYADLHVPEKAIALYEEDVEEMLTSCGLALAFPPFYGAWTGRSDSLSFQDIIVIAKE